MAVNDVEQIKDVDNRKELEKQLIKDNIKKEMEDDKPYAMCVRALVNALIDID